MGAKVNRDYFTRFISLLVSVGLWLYVVYAENPQQEIWLKGIPVEYVNQEALDVNSVTIVSGKIDTVSVKVSGRRKDITRLKQTSHKARIDLLSVTAEGSYQLPISFTFMGDGVTITDKKPYNAQLSVEKVVTRELPLRVVPDKTPQDGFSIDDITVLPETVRIKGARSAVAQIGEAIAELNMKNFEDQKTHECEVRLLKTDGSAYKGHDITVLDKIVKVQASVVKTYLVPIKAQVHGADGAEIQSVVLDTEETELKLAAEAENEIGELYTKPVTVEYSDTPVSVVLELDIPDGAEAGITSVNAVVTFKPSEEAGAAKEENETN